MEPSGGIQQHRVEPVLPGVADGVLGDLDRVDLTQGEDGDVQLLSHNLQLGDGGGAVHVAGHQQGPLAQLPFQVARQLGAVGGLTGALEAHHHDDRGALGGEMDLLIAAAHELGELFVDDLDDLLGGGEAFQHVRAHGPLGDFCYEVLDHAVADVCVQQGEADLLHGLPDVGLGNAPLAPQASERGVQFLGKSFKCHGLSLLIPLKPGPPG